MEPDQVAKVIEESEDVRAFTTIVSKAVEDWWSPTELSWKQSTRRPDLRS